MLSGQFEAKSAICPSDDSNEQNSTTELKQRKTSKAKYPTSPVAKAL